MSLQNAIDTELARLDAMIPEAQKRLAKAAQQMLRRGQRAAAETDAMLAGRIYMSDWARGADSDAREAQDAYAELSRLLDKHNLLRNLKL